ncbi:glycosyltransferase family 4 protein [Tessaracoccus sp. OS52]|uniref:glycosyltransferase family 4 protein n=1 Tax=Tessaracoccus sp. OS52 TaxID=2886691 RepID=UPI001D123191|nr:glycosyltransferase family 4 protein [Tessaracoccus sp. OS52]MCC2594616.1 glycosyltransferase family 4 protein [Tessaracoccus sp. OS52]
MSRSVGGIDPHVLVIVQNLPIQVDRRVLLEFHELLARGYRVSLICPKGPSDAAREVIDGARIYKYRPAPEAKGLAGYALEFGYSWLRTAWLSAVAWREGGRFHVIQACNPPDTYWLLALLWRIRGVRFIFDHHDLNPELFLSRFGQPKSLGQRLQLKGLGWLERMTFRTADRVISTNDSYRRIAIRRGRREPSEVDVVRSGPDTVRMRPIYPADPVPEGVTMLTYIGIMGPQDGVDQVLELVAELRRRGRDDIRATLMGFGDCLEDLKRQCTRLGLDDVVTFTGRVDKREIAEHLSRAHIGICPDLKTPLNDVSTMNKSLEYMAYALPAVAFDLAETRVTGGEAVRYVPSGDVVAMADEVELLIEDPELRTRLGRLARERVTALFDWAGQAKVFGDVFDDVLGRTRADEVSRSPEPGDSDEWGRTYVPLSDEAEFDRFILERRAR